MALVVTVLHVLAFLRVGMIVAAMASWHLRVSQASYAVTLAICRDLAEQIGQDRGLTNVAPGDLDSSNLRRFLVYPEIDLAPDPPFGATMPAGGAFDPRSEMLTARVL